MAARRRKEAPPAPAASEDRAPEPAAAGYVARHLRWGWWMLLAFLSLGIFLESLHGFKIEWYLAVANQTRRLMWTLAHTHGTLIGLIHLALAATLGVPGVQPAWPEARLRLASLALIWAGLLIPPGFFLGGVIFHAGDPGLGILLVPAGSAALFLAILLTARAVASRRP